MHKKIKTCWKSLKLGKTVQKVAKTDTECVIFLQIVKTDSTQTFTSLDNWGKQTSSIFLKHSRQIAGIAAK